MPASFTRGFPPDGFTLGQTKVQIRDNLDGTFDTFSIDHENQNQAIPGHHTVIHQVTQGADPAAIAGVNQIYSKVPTFPANGDTQLFTRTGLGGISQLTGSGSNGNGTFFFSNSFIFQCGQVASVANSGTQNFPITFPTSLISIQITATVNNTTSHAFAYCVRASSTSSFDWIVANSVSAASTGFFWVAIGN